MSASFDAYKIFYYVGKYKNITHAATALFLSQSTVSRSIQSLESELGCKLFSRTQFGVAFTIEGATLYEHISKACEQIFIGEEKVLRMQQLSEGDLRIGVSDITFSQFVLPALKDFHNDFPSVHLEISSKSFYYETAFDALLSGKIDIACIVSAVPSDINSGAVDIVPVATFHDMVIASEQFSDLKKGSYYFEDLNAYPFVSLVNNMPKLSYLDRLFIAHGLNISPEFKVDSISMFIPMVKSCKCLALVPSLFRSEFGPGDPVFEVNMKESLPEHNVCILTSKSAPQSSARDAFVRQLKKYIKSKIYNASSAEN